MTHTPTLPATVEITCGHRPRPRDERCQNRVDIRVRYTPLPGYRPARFRVTGNGRCAEGHACSVWDYVSEDDGPTVAREVHGGLPGLGKRAR